MLYSLCSIPEVFIVLAEQWVKTAFSGSAPLPVELFNRFEKATGVNIIEGYGLTEATVLVSGNPVDGVKKIGSIGIRFPYSEIKIVKTEGGQLLECDPNEIGQHFDELYYMNLALVI